MTSHLYRWRSAFIPMWWDVRWGRHHHRISMLKLGALMVVRVGISLNGSGRHRGPRPCTIWWRWVCTRRGHVTLRWRHLTHPRRVHSIWRRHARRIRHRLHVRPRHICTWRTRGRHSRHHVLCWVTIRRIGINIAT